MDFGFSEEQEMLKNFARDFLEKECPEKLVRDMEEDEKGYSPELWQKMAEQGWQGLIIPPEYGGSGMTFGRKSPNDWVTEYDPTSEMDDVWYRKENTSDETPATHSSELPVFVEDRNRARGALPCRTPARTRLHRRVARHKVSDHRTEVAMRALLTLLAALPLTVAAQGYPTIPQPVIPQTVVPGAGAPVPGQATAMARRSSRRRRAAAG